MLVQTAGIKKSDDPAKVRDAAQQFEALLISQLLKISREADSSGGWMGTGDDQAGSIGLEVAEQQLAQTLAAHGGFGLAKMIGDGLERAKAAAAPVTDPPAASPLPGAAASQPGSDE
jgi:Rod binding domain-containing protein